MALDPLARVHAEVVTLDVNATQQPSRGGRGTQSAHYEYRVLTLAETTNRNEARRLLTDEAEYGRWELARSLLFPGGRRKVWLRRKIMHVQRSL